MTMTKPPNKLVALFLVRNEEWILRASLTAAREWCDQIIVMDHNSIDSTPQIAKDMADVYIRKDGDEWFEMEFRQELLNAGRKLEGTHFALIDADEILTANLYESVRNAVFSYRCGEVFLVPMVTVWRSPFQYRNDLGSPWANARISVAFADDRFGPLEPKIHYSVGREKYQHHQREPKFNRGLVYHGVKTGGCMHLQWVVWDRVVAKHRWYKMMERVRYPEKPPELIDRQYNLTINEDGLNLANIPSEWIDPAVFDQIVLDHTPWHVEACREMIRKHGEAMFSGLELWW